MEGTAGTGSQAGNTWCALAPEDPQRRADDARRSVEQGHARQIAAGRRQDRALSLSADCGQAVRPGQRALSSGCCAEPRQLVLGSLDALTISWFSTAVKKCHTCIDLKQNLLSYGFVG